MTYRLEDIPRLSRVDTPPQLLPRTHWDGTCCFSVVGSPESQITSDLGTIEDKVLRASTDSWAEGKSVKVLCAY